MVAWHQFLFRAGPGIGVDHSDMQEFKQHQAEMVIASHSRLVQWSPIIVAACLALLVVSKISSQPLPDEHMRCLVGFALVWVGGLVCDRFKDRASAQLHACMSQCAVLVVLLVTLATCLLRSTNPVQQHRTFVAAFGNTMSTFTFMGYVPFAVQIGAGVTSVAIWIYFHVHVDFLNLNSVAYGFCIVAFSIGFGIFQRAANWNAFKAKRDLDRERKFLDDVLKTLHSLLSTLFDASCTCDASGAMLSSSPHLQSMLGGDWSAGLPQISSFLSSDEERDRLGTFLKSVTANSNSNAQSLQTSFRMANVSTKVDAKVFAIKLPDRDGKDIAFIGLQAIDGAFQLEEAELPDDGAARMRELVATTQRSLRKDVDDCGESLFSLSLTEVSSAVGGTAAQIVSEQRALLEGIEEPDVESPPEATENEEDNSATATDRTEPEMVSMPSTRAQEEEDRSSTDRAEPEMVSMRPTGAHQEEHYAPHQAEPENLSTPSTKEVCDGSSEHQFCGTEKQNPSMEDQHPEPLPPMVLQQPAEDKASDDSSVPGDVGATHCNAAAALQDEESDDSSVPGDVRRTFSGSRPPPLPGASHARPPQRRMRKKAGASEKRDCRVVLDTPKKLLPDFKETPTESVKVLLLTAMCQFNSRGQGCCAWHVQVAHFQRIVATMTKADCMPSFQVFSGWQCGSCECMNNVEEDSDDEDTPLLCRLCGHDDAVESVGSRMSDAP